MAGRCFEARIVGFWEAVASSEELVREWRDSAWIDDAALHLLAIATRPKPQSRHPN